MGKYKKSFIVAALTILFALMSGIIAFYEYRTHQMLYILDAMRICKMDDTLNPRHSMITAWAASLNKLDDDFEIAFIGDSHIAGSNFHKVFPDRKIITFGVGGDRVDMAEDRLPIVVAANPKKLFIEVGINDLHRSDAEVVAARYRELMASVKKITSRDLDIHSKHIAHKPYKRETLQTK